MEGTFSNLTGFDRFISRIAFVPKWAAKGINYMLIAYPIIKNWDALILYRAAFIPEPKVKLRSKMRLPFFFRFLTNRFGYESKMIEGNWINFEYTHKRLRMYFDTQRQMINTLELIKDQFIGEEYKMLDVKGRDVVDIGANVADTAIYFALNGASHVYSFEPYPYSCKIARKNVVENELEGKISILNECCTGKSGTVLINENFENDERTPLIKSKSGKKIRSVTIKEIVSRYNIDGAVLKVDCEGDEYGLILNCDQKTLRRFNQILIEYHYGFRNLAKKLEECGFEVRCDIPSYGKNPIEGREGMHYGLIVARICR